MDDETSAGRSDAPRPAANSVTLYVRLLQELGRDVNYDAQKKNLSARCLAQGYVWNTDSEFQFKRCNVTFHRQATGDLPKFALEHGLDGACGSIQIAPRLEPEKFDADGKEFDLPPIEIYIVVDSSGYDQTQKLLSDCLSTNREMSLSLAFSHRDFTRPFMNLDDLDLATKSIYPIVRFDLGGIRQKNKTVVVPNYDYTPEAAAGLTFTATAASIQASVRNSAFSVPEIKLTGKLWSQKLGITADDETMEIKEYEENFGWKGGYPEEAFPGVVSVSKKETIIYCSVTLFATKEILIQLATLLAGMSKGDTVTFSVSMIVVGLPLKVGETKYFDVTNYMPVLTKSYL